MNDQLTNEKFTDFLICTSPVQINIGKYNDIFDTYQFAKGSVTFQDILPEIHELIQ